MSMPLFAAPFLTEHMLSLSQEKGRTGFQPFIRPIIIHSRYLNSIHQAYAPPPPFIKTPWIDSHSILNPILFCDTGGVSAASSSG